MSEKEYIVLRSESNMVPAFDNLGGPRGFGARPFESAPETIELKEASLSKADRDDLRRDPRTKAIAESMPMKLVEPTASEDAAVPAGATETWGVKAVRASDSPLTGANIVVAVLDTGIDPGHAAFQGVALVRKNFTTESDDDLHGHGTHCAGTILGQDVNGMRIGVARGVKRALIGKVLGQGGGSSATIARAIQWAVNEGAHVVSMSLGIDFPGFVKFLVENRGVDPAPATSMALEAYRANINLFSELAKFVQAQSAFLQGTTIIAASGNESKRPTFEISVAPPAAGTGIVAVGALAKGTNGLTVADFSNNQVNVAAPGVDIISAAVGGGLRSMSGTSMATPHVAGVAALWAQRELDQTGRVDAQTLMSRIIASGRRDPLAAGVQAEDVGTGIVQSPLN